MRRIAYVSFLALGIASAARSQFLQSPYGRNSAVVQDFLGNYDSNQNYTFASFQQSDIENPVNTDSYAADPAWSATNLSGSASGNGEGAYAHGSLTNSAGSAVYDTYLSGTADLTSNITNRGPYYGVAADAHGSGNEKFGFTTSTTTLMSLTGEVTGQGPSSQEMIQLFNLTDGTIDYSFTTNTTGSAGIAFSEQLVSGGTYELAASVEGGASVNYDAAGHAENLPGVGAATAYLNASFTPAPEPASIALLGLGIVGLISRRRRK